MLACLRLSSAYYRVCITLWCLASWLWHSFSLCITPVIADLQCLVNAANQHETTLSQLRCTRFVACTSVVGCQAYMRLCSQTARASLCCSASPLWCMQCNHSNHYASHLVLNVVAQASQFVSLHVVHVSGKAVQVAARKGPNMPCKHKVAVTISLLLHVHTDI